MHRAGPLFVLAGPGSGKTQVITRHIAFRVRRTAVPPQRILAITFTNRAAEEMRRRVADLLGGDLSVRIGTFHWMSSALLRRYSDRLGIRRDFRLLSAPESHAVLRGVLREGTNLSRTARALSAIKNGAALEAAGRAHSVPVSELGTILATYDRALEAMAALDLDDLLLRTAQLLRTHDVVRYEVQQRFDSILVDEFQDTNPIQAEIVRLMAPVDRTVIAVGDDDQAIYEWRQASGGSALFDAAFPDAETVVLGESYRHTKRILRAASTLIDHNSRRAPKRLSTRRPAGDRPVHFVARDENEEAEWIAERIAAVAARGSAYGDIGVLYRVHSQSRALEDALVRHDIPYRVLAGQRFYERPEIQRVLAYVRLALDPADDEATGQLVRGVAGMGEVRLDVVRRHARDAGVTVLAALEEHYAPHEIPARIQERLRVLAGQARSVLAVRERSMGVVVERAVDATRTDLEARASDRDALLENLDELVTVVRQFEAQRGTLRGLIDRLTVQPDNQQGTHGVSLLSLHAAKGLEFATVFVTGLEEGLLPHRRSLDRDEDVEAERRLAYVGVTRARDFLFLSHAQMRFMGGHAFSSGESRFLGEMGISNLTVERSGKATRRPRLATVHCGERVDHPRWGAGTVVSIEGKGRETLVTVQFDAHGRQRLQLCHAPLTRLQGEENPRVR